MALTPSIQTDKADYAPGETVTLTGANWQSGEIVTILVNDNIGNSWSYSADVTAADDGTIRMTFQLPNWFVATYSVTATGKDSGVATTTFTDANSAGNLDQCRNGGPTSPAQCSGSAWVNGNANSVQAHYVEGYSIPYREIMTDLPTGTSITIVLGYDIKHSGAHAIDYLTHYQRLEPHASFGHPAEVVSPLSGVSGVSGTVSTFAIPAPSSAGSPKPGQPTASFNALPASERLFTLFGGTITGISYVSEGSLSADTSETQIAITFTADSSTAVLAWGGHIASALDWGSGNSAGAITGSPYHMSQVSWTLGSLGNQDRALAATAVKPAGTIVIIKDAIPNDPQDFSFTTTGGLSPASFSLDDDADNTLSNTQPFSSIAAGTYSVSEVTIPSGWDLTNLVCTVSPSGTSTFTSTPPTVSINLKGGDTVTCTFTDTKRGHIIVDKLTDPTPDSTNIFSFTTTGTGYNPFNLKDTDTPNDQTLAPGSYTVTETNPSSLGFDLSNLVCTPTGTETSVTPDLANRKATITLGAGGSVTCRFTDTKQRGHIIVDKVTDPSPDSTTSFSFTTTGTGYNGFSLKDTDTPNDQTLVPGTYTVTETNPSSLGFDLSNLVCTPTGTETSVTPDLANRKATITLGAGGSVTCTFTNSKRGQITVIKRTIPSPDPTDTSFSFTTTGTGYNPFSLKNGESNDQTLVPGIYSVTETDPAPAFDLTSLTCVVAGTGTSTSVDNRKLTITLGAGGSVTCTYTDTKRGHIRVDKVTSPGGDTQEFGFAASWDSGDDPDFTLADATTPYDSGALVPGTYTVAETVPTGWDLTGLSCEVSQGGTSTWDATGSPTVSVVLKAGDTVTCTYTDTKRGQITIIKDTVPNDAQDFSYTSTGGLSPASFSLDDDADSTLSNTQRFTNVLPGTYTVTEGAVTGFDLTGLTCTATGTGTSAYGDKTTGVATITLGAGGSVTCTYGNTKRGHIVVDKVTVPSGDPYEFEFAASWDSGDDPDFTLADATTPYDSGALVPGTYTVAETVPTGWDLTNLACTVSEGGTSTFDVSGSPTASIVLKAGDTVTCTYTDTKHPTLTLVKKVKNNYGGSTGASTWTLSATGTSGSFSGTGIPNADDTEATLGPKDVTANVEYTLDESTVTGYTKGTWTCYGDVSSTNGKITLGFGQDDTCEITNNDQPATLIVKKHVVNDNGGYLHAGDFCFKVNSGNPICFIEDPNNPLEGEKRLTVPAGTYTITEDQVSVYVKKLVDCAGIEIGNGGTAICDITNDDFNFPPAYLDKSVTTSDTITYTWDIVKTEIANTREITLSPTETYKVKYEVTVTPHSSEAVNVHGVITFINSLTIPLTVTGVTDQIVPTATNSNQNSISATVEQCSLNGELVTFDIIMQPDDTLTCPYHADLSNTQYDTNTLTVHLIGAEELRSKPVTFQASNVDDCVTVTDSLYPSLGGSTCEVAKTFNSGDIYLGPYNICKDYPVVNTATYTTDDTKTQKSSTWRITVHVPCLGCTLTQGYWKTHSKYGPAKPADPTWNLIGGGKGPDTVFFSPKNKQTWITVFNTPVKGDPYYQLAYQYMAARLNILKGAFAPKTVTDALSTAEGIFTTYGPGQIPSNKKAQVTNLASLLDRYNNGGTAGWPPHCPE